MSRMLTHATIGRLDKSNGLLVDTHFVSVQDATLEYEYGCTVHHVSFGASSMRFAEHVQDHGYIRYMPIITKLENAAALKADPTINLDAPFCRSYGARYCIGHTHARTTFTKSQWTCQNDGFVTDNFTVINVHCEQMHSTDLFNASNYGVRVKHETVNANGAPVASQTYDLFVNGVHNSTHTTKQDAIDEAQRHDERAHTDNGPHGSLSWTTTTNDTVYALGTRSISYVVRPTYGAPVASQTTDEAQRNAYHVATAPQTLCDNCRDCYVTTPRFNCDACVRESLDALRASSDNIISCEICNALLPRQQMVNFVCPDCNAKQSTTGAPVASQFTYAPTIGACASCGMPLASNEAQIINGDYTQKFHGACAQQEIEHARLVSQIITGVLPNVQDITTLTPTQARRFADYARAIVARNSNIQSLEIMPTENGFDFELCETNGEIVEGPHTALASIIVSLCEITDPYAPQSTTGAPVASQEYKRPACVVCNSPHAMFLCVECCAAICPEHGYSHDVSTGKIFCKQHASWRIIAENAYTRLVKSPHVRAFNYWQSTTGFQFEVELLDGTLTTGFDETLDQVIAAIESMGPRNPSLNHGARSILVDTIATDGNETTDLVAKFRADIQMVIRDNGATVDTRITPRSRASEYCDSRHCVQPNTDLYVFLSLDTHEFITAHESCHASSPRLQQIAPWGARRFPSYVLDCGEFSIEDYGAPVDPDAYTKSHTLKCSICAPRHNEAQQLHARTIDTIHAIESENKLRFVGLVSGVTTDHAVYLKSDNEAQISMVRRCLEDRGFSTSGRWNATQRAPFYLDVLRAPSSVQDATQTTGARPMSAQFQDATNDYEVCAVCHCGVTNFKICVSCNAPICHADQVFHAGACGSANEAQ